MAVQAQYPSNVLLLNRGVEEAKNQIGNDYSLQPQPGGGDFLDQSHMLFDNGMGTTNTRKRGREMNAFSMQSHQPSHQLIDLTQLHNNAQSNLVSTGLQLAFGEPQQQLNPHHHHHHQQQTLSSSQSCSSVLFSLLSEDLSTQIRQQRDEIEQFLHAQGEELRRTLAEKRRRHYNTLLGAAEESAARRLREKEAEVERAARRHSELEARAAQLSVEAQAWRAKAREQEAEAATLQGQLQHAMMSVGCARQEEDDDGVGGLGLGCADGVEDAESAYIDPHRVVVTSVVGGPSCKLCQKRVASVVLLPCRHFCLCTECETVAQACPLCLSFRNASVEVFLS